MMSQILFNDLPVDVEDYFHQPLALYLYPWEIDPGQPRIRAGLKSRFRHYHNLGHTESRVENLISSSQFAPMRDVLDSVLSDAAALPVGNPFR